MPGHEQAGDQTKSRGTALVTYKVLGGGHQLFTGSTLIGYFQRCPRKSRAGTWDRNPKLGSFSKCPDSGCESVGCAVTRLSSISEWLFSRHIRGGEEAPTEAGPWGPGGLGAMSVPPSLKKRDSLPIPPFRA